MISQKFLMITGLSTLLVTTALGASKSNCVGGVCVVNLDKLQPLKKIEHQEESSVNNNIDNSMTIVLDGETITVFPKSSYMMNEEEDLDFMLLSEPLEAVEDKILEKTNLPSSEYFCEKDKHPVYINNDIYECV